MKIYKMLVFSLALMLVIGSVAFVAVGIDFSSETEMNDEEVIIGSGTRDDPVMIYDVHDLQDMNLDLSGHYALGNDINASETAGWNDDEGFEPIGNDAARFTGSLEGHGNTISGLYINRPNTDEVGLFGTIGSQGTVRGVGIVDGEVIGESYVGLLAGSNYGTVEDSYSTGSVLGNYRRTGGLIGNNDGGTVERCYSNADVTGLDNVVGGLVGMNIAGGSIINSYAHGNVTGASLVGGLSGNNYQSSITRSYAAGNVSGTGTLGGLSGWNYEGSVLQSFYDLETTGQSDTDRGEPKTTEEMKTLSTFTDADWDITAVISKYDTDPYHLWNIVETSTYPFFSWQEFLPIEVYTWEDLHDIQDDIYGTYQLMNDLTPDTEGYDEYASPLANDGVGWNPIGERELFGEPFNGIFDGHGYSISGLFHNSTTGLGSGLFGAVGEHGMLSNTTLIDVNITARDYVGAIAGWNDGAIYSCNVEGSIIGTRNYVGGLIGNNLGEIYSCTFQGTVSGEGQIGSLVGRNSYVVMDSHAEAQVEGISFVGGLIGVNFNNGHLENGFFEGEVTGVSSVGGLVGSYRAFSSTDRGVIINTHYNIDEVLINGGNHVTRGGLFDEQYTDWKNDMSLDISDYHGYLVPVNGDHQISSVDGMRYLLGFSESDEYSFVLTDDLHMPPGLYIPYMASDFHGNDHTLYGLHLDLPFVQYVGLFGYNYRATIENLNIIDAEITGRTTVGVLVGHVFDGPISDVHVSGSVTGLGSNTGGLIGYSNSVITRTSSTASVTGTLQVGGLIGMARTNNLYESYATGNVIGERLLGGLIGDGSYGQVQRSYSTGSVTRTTGEWENIGGFVGRIFRGKVIHCYSTGSVHYQGADDPTDRGFAGDVNNESIHFEMTGNFWDVQTSGQTDTVGNATGLPTAQMKTQSTFTDADWDFDDVWHMVDGFTYPLFQYQELPDVDDFSIDLTVTADNDGWNFVSFNLLPADSSPEAILADIEGNYDQVMWYQSGIYEVEYETIFFDNGESGGMGFTYSTSHAEASEWDLRDHDAYSGDFSYDFGDGLFNKNTSYGMSSWLISPEIDLIDANSPVLTFQHWRDWGDTALFDAGNVKISTDGTDGPWTLIIPEEGYDGTVPTDWDNPLGGEEAYGGIHYWTQATFDLSGFEGETIHIGWFAGVDNWDGDYGAGWRVDNIEVRHIIDETSEPDSWYSFVPDRAEHFNTFLNWDHTMGVWIQMNSDVTLTVSGIVPVSTDITLQPGWNMVGLPSESSGNHGLPGEVDRIGYFEASDEYNLVYDYDPENFIFEPGQGYWIYNGADHSVVWNVEY